MDFEGAFKAVMKKMVVRRSQWQFVTLGGAALTVGTPIAKLAVGGAGGALWVKRDSDADTKRLTFGGLSGSVGLSLIPSPVNFSFSLPAMPSAGRIYKLPAAGRTLSFDEMRGPFVMMEVAADWTVGGTAALMFIGGNALLAGALMSTPLGMPTFLATCEACVAFSGMSVTAVPVNASVSLYAGAIL